MSWLRKFCNKKDGYVVNIEDLTVDNKDFRNVLYTSNNMQLVVMSIPPGEDIGEEVHGLDQFIRVESGKGSVILNGDSTEVKDGDCVIIPQGVTHNFKNTSEEDLKLYTIYSPPNHKKDVVHSTKSDATEEHYDGVNDV